MTPIFYFFTVLLIITLIVIAYFAGYAYGRLSEGKPIEMMPLLKKKKPPDPKVEAQISEYNRQLYNIEHYTGSPDGMKRKGGDKQ